MSGYAVNIIQTDQGVNMGDHGQDVIRAVAPKPDETVQQLIERTLMTFSWDDSGPGTPPGFEAHPDPAPTKTSAGYLAWLAAQPYPDGWEFWCLAGTTGRADPHSEWVVLVRDRQMREACVDLRTGAVVKWGERL